jgi:Holliday junction resolvasome RuvABC ATP-dependent DNA helicase subunit
MDAWDEMDNKILTTIIEKFKGGPVGLTFDSRIRE